MISLPVICTEVDFLHRELSHPRHFQHQDRPFRWGDATHLISKPLKSRMWLAMNGACRNISSYPGQPCHDKHMETWIIALLQHATIVDLQDSQDGSHVIVLPHFAWGCIPRKTLTCVGSPYIIGYSILIHQAIIAVRPL